jgi:hypothetical protein
MKKNVFAIGAALGLIWSVAASADEMLDTAKAEMEAALGTVPPFIALRQHGGVPLSGSPSGD